MKHGTRNVFRGKVADIKSGAAAAQVSVTMKASEITLGNKD